MSFRVRIVTIDHYSYKPVPDFDPVYSIFRVKDVQQVPIVRIFGTSEKGQKTCLHVHGFFPYFSIQATALGSQCSTQNFAHELDRQINTELNRSGQHVYAIEEVQSTNFYGFHREPEIFLKILFYSEQARKKAVNILRSGHFMGKSFDVFEAHFSLITQFFVNFNLFGMNFIDLNLVWPRQLSDLSLLGNCYAGSAFPREKQTSCELEIDCTTDKIINAMGIGGEMNPGLKLIWAEEIGRRAEMKQEKDELFKDIIDMSTRQERQTGLEKDYFQSLRTLFQTGNSQELYSRLSLNEFYSQSHAWQTFLSQSESQPLVKKKQPLVRNLNHNQNTICTQELIDLLKFSQNSSIDEHLFQEFLEGQDNREDGEESGEEAEEEFDDTLGGGNIIIPSLDIRINPVGNSQIDSHSSVNSGFPSQEDASTFVNGETFNLNSESIIHTPMVACNSNHNTSISLNNEFRTTSAESFLQKEFYHSSENLLFGEDEELDFVQDFDKSQSYNLADLTDSKLCEGGMSSEHDLFENTKVSSTLILPETIVPKPTTYFDLATSPSFLNLHSNTSSSINQSQFSFCNISQSQTSSNQASLSKKFSSQRKKLKRSRLNTTSDVMLFGPNSPDRCSTPTVFRSTSDRNVESDFVSKIRKLIDNSSQGNVHDHDYQHLTLMSMELFAISDNEIKPDPQKDPIKMIFFQIYQDSPPDTVKFDSKRFTGAILRVSDVEKLDLTFSPNICTTLAEQKLSQSSFNPSSSQTSQKRQKIFPKTGIKIGFDVEEVNLKAVNSEVQIIEYLLKLVQVHDPDILIGFEIETSSWGYLNQRAKNIGIDCSKYFSRLKSITNTEKQNGNHYHKTDCVGGDVLGPTFTTSNDNIFGSISQEKGISGIKKGPAMFKTNNYLRRNGVNFKAPNIKKLWQKFDELRNADEPQNDKSQGNSQEQDGQQFEQELENFFSLSYVSPCYMNFTGRIMLNVWRLLRKEIALTSYSFENVYFHAMNRRVPHYTYHQLNQWFTSRNNFLRGRVFEYFLFRARGCMELLEKMDVIGRHSELARVFGIQFSDVIAKGTQFRVESLLYRSTIRDNLGKKKKRMLSQEMKSQDFMLLSCDFKKRNRQHDPFMIPFVMDPFSGFYTDPIAVLDFQSLYPSIMIAYNYCYSTCLGRLESMIDPKTDFFGCSSLRPDADFIRDHLDDVTISPNGLIYLKQHIRKGILCSILEELLNTRIMVKNSIKLHSKQDQPSNRLLRQLDARQLGLKLIANVTYGYTAAGFSGRMPCVDLADAIISKGRETLMEAIQLVQQSRSELGGDVVYGDTDSIFIRFSGFSVDEAFRRAALLCDRITSSNPKPIKIKLEKVYSRSVLLTKKRYAGYAYESPSDIVPKLDCKGIETVRRDSIPLVKRVLDRALRLLFSTPETELSSLKKELRSFLESEFIGVLKNHRRRLHEFVFAREYRGQFGYRPGQLLPSIVIAEQLVSRYGENCRPFSKQRVPYVVCWGDRPKEPLARLVRLPLDLLRAESARLNCSYYIEKVLIPPLQRVFGLLGCNLFSWYNDMPGKSRFLSFGYANCQRGTVAKYFQTDECTICDGRMGTNQKALAEINPNSQLKLQSSLFPLCKNCFGSPDTAAIQITEFLREFERGYLISSRACHLCVGVNGTPEACQSIDCPNLFRAHADRLLMSKQKEVIDQLNDLAIRFYENS